MEDLMAKLQSILSTQEGQAQLNNIASMLSSNGGEQATSTNTTTNTQASQDSNTGGGLGGLGGLGGFDMSMLAGLMGGGATPVPTPPPNNPITPPNSANAGDSGSFDFSKIAQMLSGMGGGASLPNAPTTQEQSDMPNIDINMILKLQQVFSSMNVNDKNAQLLKALKPHFSEKRSKKVDQAISMMRLMSMLPMLKESGIFTGL